MQDLQLLLQHRASLLESYAQLQNEIDCAPKGKKKRKRRMKDRAWNLLQDIIQASGDANRLQMQESHLAAQAKEKEEQKNDASQKAGGKADKNGSRT